MVEGPVAVIGVGLMGASLGLALRERAGVDVVRGFDASSGNAADALARGAITERASSIEAAAAGASTVFLATPVPYVAELAKIAIGSTDETCVVTDIGSTKGGVLRALSPEERRRFVGGHPICGGETSGPTGARSDLFDGAAWFLTPPDEIDPELYTRVHRIVAAVGARPTAIDVDEHDRLMAFVSHLPHVLAAMLVNAAADATGGGRDALSAAGPSFRDLTRVAGSNPDLWADILIENASALGPVVRESGVRLAVLAAAIEERDRDAILAEFAAARDGHSRIGPPAPEGGERITLEVAVADRPGALSAITTALGDAAVNIADLSLRPGPPGGQGTLLVTVEGGADAELARGVLSRSPDL